MKTEIIAFYARINIPGHLKTSPVSSSECRGVSTSSGSTLTTAVMKPSASDWLMLTILTSHWLVGYAVHPMAIDQDLMVAARVMDKPGLELRNVDKMYPEYR